MRWRPQILLVLVAALVAAGCSDDGDPSTVERAEVTTTDAPTSTTESPTTTTLQPCPDIGTPSGDEELTEQADVDGDGERDELISARTGDDSWELAVELARGGGAVLDMDTFGGPVGVVGGADVDGDGSDEVWARTGAGASTTIVGLFAVEDCELARVTFATGGPVELPVGGSVGTTSGVECDDGKVLVHTATYVGDGSDDRYQVETVTYSLEGGSLVEAERASTEAAASDQEFLRYTTFSCGELLL